MKRSEKDAIIDEVAERISAAQALYFADFSGVTVAEESELRREFRKAGVGYTVAKNTLIRKALERVTGYDKVYDTLVGPTGIAFCGDDVAAPAKIIKKFSGNFVAQILCLFDILPRFVVFFSKLFFYSCAGVVFCKFL